ncbi:MAG: chromate transporter [Acidobacteria bacterium]|nr:chromate transporter [Acidobacteriota bacterium]MBI3424126.1 chromate transporter [Acidobacteriota bacterium]
MKATGDLTKARTTKSQPTKRSLKTRLREFSFFAREWIAEQFPLPEERIAWRALAETFLHLGATGFGGGIAVIGQIRRLVVREREWMSEEEFLDAVSLAQSLPGANAANAITYVGLKLGGLRGAAVSVASFILPSFLMMMALTIAHGHLSERPDAKLIFQGFNAAVVGLIAATTARLGQTAMQRQWHLELGVAAGFVLIFTDTTVAEVVLLAGLIGVFIQSFRGRVRQRWRRQARKEKQAEGRSAVAQQQARQHAAEMIEHPDQLTDDYKVEVSLPPQEAEPPKERPTSDRPTNDPVKPPAEKKSTTGKLVSFVPFAALPLLAWPILSKLVAVWHLASIFLRVGSVTFGGGFVMIPQIETDVVNVHQWMTHQAFADGMAFGQITPGPVLITATFIGYKVAGVLGALVATIAAFLPSFVMTVIAGTSLNRFRTNHQVQAFLGGVAPAVVGMLAAAGVSLAKSGVSGSTGFGIATLAFLLMMRAAVNPVIIIFGCGMLQWAIARGLIGLP